MKNISLIIDGQEFEVGFRLLRKLSDSLPEEDQYNEIARALINLDIPSITLSVIERGKLEMEDMDKLWQSGNQDIRRALLSQGDFIEFLTEQQAQEIMDSGDTDMADSLAYWFENLMAEEDAEDQTSRLSVEMAKKLTDYILNYPDQSVRNTLWDNDFLPAKYCPGFKQCLDACHYLSTATLVAMKKKDLELLPQLPLEDLKTLAGNVEDIKNKKLREEVAIFLANYSDPAVRMKLAQNPYTPLAAKEILGNDADFDIRAAVFDPDQEDEDEE